MAARPLADDDLVDTEADVPTEEVEPSLLATLRESADEVTLSAGEARGLDTSPLPADPARD